MIEIVENVYKKYKKLTFAYNHRKFNKHDFKITRIVLRIGSLKICSYIYVTLNIKFTSFF